MLHLNALLIATLLAGGAWAFAWDGGAPPPHRRSLALPSGGRPAASGSHLAHTLQRSLLQQGNSSSGCSSGSSSSSSGQGHPPCTTRPQTGSSQSDVLVQICGDPSACSVLLVAIGVIVLLIVFACGLSGLCSRRRQQQQVEDAEVPAPVEAHVIGLAVHHPGLPDAECESVRAMPPEKQAELEVRPVREGDEAWGSRQECSICLEGVAADESGAWMVFPCHPIHHGACRACVADLVRYNQRPDRRVVHCPLCRCLALVPPSCLPPGTLTAERPAAAAAAARSGQAAMRPLGDGSWRLFWLV